jgi:hypothetical protein
VTPQPKVQNSGEPGFDRRLRLMNLATAIALLNRRLENKLELPAVCLKLAVADPEKAPPSSLHQQCRK